MSRKKKRLSYWTVVASAMYLFGTTLAPAQTFTLLHTFNFTDGAEPDAPLVQGTDGNFYGTTFNGGTHNSGTVFKVGPDGSFSTIYNFCSQNGCVDGANPHAGLIQSREGNLYGTTTGGGTNFGSGTIFRIDTSGTLTTLYNFCATTNCVDGGVPYSSLLQASDGSFYGTTTGGGTGYGTVFKMSHNGALTTLYSFCAQYPCLDGAFPYGGLVQALDGNFYGTTLSGGLNREGSIFKITPAGVVTTLYTFCAQGNGCVDGAQPYATLVQNKDGYFYGTTYNGGTFNGGTVFKINSTGNFVSMYSFCTDTNCSNGYNPYAGLIQATDGNFYGTTVSFSAIFKISTSGLVTNVYQFCLQNGCTDGTYPYGGVIQATDGAFYGTNQGINGGLGHGTVFKLAAGLGPFAEVRPGFGKVGAIVQILGNNLSGATSVTFNGSSAAFQVTSNSLITARVPNSGTNGPVRVTTASGTIVSNLPFHVYP